MHRCLMNERFLYRRKCRRGGVSRECAADSKINRDSPRGNYSFAGGGYFYEVAQASGLKCCFCLHLQKGIQATS